VIEVNDSNFMSFMDLEVSNQDFATSHFLIYPHYIDEVMNNPNEAKVSGVNLHK